jgi:hypothetical protein
MTRYHPIFFLSEVSFPVLSDNEMSAIFYFHKSVVRCFVRWRDITQYFSCQKCRFLFCQITRCHSIFIIKCFIPRLVERRNVKIFIPRFVGLRNIKCFIPRLVGRRNVKCFISRLVGRRNVKIFIPRFVGLRNIKCFIPRLVGLRNIKCFIPRLVGRRNVNFYLLKCYPSVCSALFHVLVFTTTVGNRQTLSSVFSFLPRQLVIDRLYLLYFRL